MFVVHIEHPVLDYDRWKETFDSDPLDRKGSGVRRYRVMRAADSPDEVIIELELDTDEEANAMLGALRKLWERVDGVLVSGPQGLVYEVAEAAEV